VTRSDALSDFDPVLAARPLTDPWEHERGEEPRYSPDYTLLTRLLAIPSAAGSSSESGRFARGVDCWLAHELRRAGFGNDEVWPRAVRPRVLPRDVAVLLERLPVKLAEEVRQRLANLPAVAPTDAKVLGRAYEKQVDVVIARWERGPELLISTKTQVSSFAKNLPNRFEEAYGDAGNLRGRYPLGAVGFFFVQRATVLDQEPDAFERTIDMIRKLRDLGSNGYTATGLALVDWEENRPEEGVHVRLDVVPEDVAPPQFLSTMVRHVLTVTPVVHHVQVREKLERRPIPVPESDVQALEGHQYND
jgi:hypothetical protein